MSYKPLICLDFDGVLHSYASGWKGVAVIPDPPFPGAIRFLQDLYESDAFKIAIYSSRSKSLRGRWAMKSWLWFSLKQELGHQAGPHMDMLYLEIFEAISWPWFKPAAHLTIDDRALTFTGEWPQLAALAAFRPWYKAA